MTHITHAGQFLRALARGAGADLETLQNETRQDLGYATAVNLLAAESFRLAARARLADARRGALGKFLKKTHLNPPLTQDIAIDRINGALSSDRVETHRSDLTLFMLLTRGAMTEQAVDELVTRAERTVTEDDLREVYPPQTYPRRTEPAGSGPWDVSDLSNPREGRADFGALLVPRSPAPEFREFRFTREGDRHAAVLVSFDNAVLRLEAFSAPFGPLWPAARAELVAHGLSETTVEREGPFGVELLFEPPAGGEDDYRLWRVLGFDGPGWMLRGLISASGDLGPKLTRVLEGVFGETVVVPPENALLSGVVLPLDLTRASE